MGSDRKRAVTVQNETYFPFRQRFGKRNGHNIAFFYGVFCQFFRVEANTQVMGNHWKNLIGGGSFHVGPKGQTITEKILNIKLSGTGIVSERNERIVCQVSEMVNAGSQSRVFGSSNQNFAEREK